MQKTVNFIKINIRYFLAALAIIAFFLVSRSFPATVITSQSCQGGSCPAMLDNPDLSDQKPSYYANDIFKSGSGQFWRLTFKARTNKDTKIKVSITNPLDTNKEIKILELSKNSGYTPQEIIFSTDSNYTDLLFEKTDPNDGADISISNIETTQLAVTNEAELSDLRPTTRGEIKIDKKDQEQTDNSFTFNQLKTPNTIFGEIIKPKSEYISSVTLDFDIVKQDNNGGKKYKFEIRQAEFDGRVPEIKSDVIASVDFTADNVERFRQSDGKFKFPLFAKLDPDKYYFIGINNNNVSVDKFNYLRLRGSQDSQKYADGSLAVKTNGKTYSAVGSLYFVSYALDYAQYQDKKILGGETIEDIGKGKGKFLYQSNENLYNLADLEQYSSDIDYDEDKDALFGKMDAGIDSQMIYRFDTVFPFQKIFVSAVQADQSWSRSAISYSYDGNNWQDIPESDNSDNIQRFDYSWNGPSGANNIFYLKIAPKEFIEGEKFGVNDFKVRADLLMPAKTKL